VIDFLNIDEKNGLVYFYASPINATQRFLYAAKLDGNSPAERMSPPVKKEHILMKFLPMENLPAIVFQITIRHQC
jgi:hypothetical protein